MAREERRFLGLACADFDANAATATIAARPARAPFGYIVTPNADHFLRLRHDPELTQIYDNALLCLLDSRVLARLARVIRLPAPRVATGSDVTAALLTCHLQRGERITIIGLRPRFLPILVARCRLAAPAHHDPPMGFEHDQAAFQAAVDFVVAHPARFVFLAVGSPRQERLAAAIKATGQATGTGLCIGAALEFLVGGQRRAPVWMQHAGLEWLFRLLSHPGRLASRYLVDAPAVFAMVWRDWRARRR